MTTLFTALHVIRFRNERGGENTCTSPNIALVPIVIARLHRRDLNRLSVCKRNFVILGSRIIKNRGRYPKHRLRENLRVLVLGGDRLRLSEFRGDAL